MEVFESYLLKITNMEQRARMDEILNWVSEKFPDLEAKVAWNQPMFTDHGTFIIGFSVSKQHISISPEKYGIDHFSAAICEAGYGHGSNLFRIKWGDEVDFLLLGDMIAFAMERKLDCSGFWMR